MQQEHEQMKQSRDTEEKLMVTAWYNLVCRNIWNGNELGNKYNNYAIKNYYVYQCSLGGLVINAVFIVNLFVNFRAMKLLVWSYNL